MNDEIRTTLKRTMRERGISHEELAQRIGIDRSAVTRILNGGSGKVNDNLQRILDELGFEVIIVPKRSSRD